jgi:hypothetical protein
LNIQQLAQHYRDVLSRTRGKNKSAVVIPVRKEQKAPEPFIPLPDPRVVPREGKNKITRQIFLTWFMETNQEQKVQIRMPVEARKIASKVLHRHQLTIQQAFCRSRAKFICDCRHEVWFALTANGYGYAQIGRMFGRDHTSIMHGVRKWREISGREYTDYIGNPTAIARRLQSRRNNLAKSEARVELDKYLERLGAMATGGDGADRDEAGSHHVGQQL